MDKGFEITCSNCGNKDVRLIPYTEEEYATVEIICNTCENSTTEYCN